MNINDTARIRIGNDQCVPEIDTWLKEYVGYGNWTEYIGITMVPYRSFQFKNPADATAFILRFL